MSGFRPLHGKPPKRIKKSGYSFASKGESALHDLLLQYERNGEIKELKVQPQVHLTDARILMKPDFSAIETHSGMLCFWEFKGFETDVWRIKRKLWFFYGEGPLYVFKGNYRKPILSEVIMPKIKKQVTR